MIHHMIAPSALGVEKKSMVKKHHEALTSVTAGNFKLPTLAGVKTTITLSIDHGEVALLLPPQPYIATLTMPRACAPSAMAPALVLVQTTPANR